MAYTKAQQAIVSRLAKKIDTAKLRDVRFLKLVRKTMETSNDFDPISAVNVYGEIIETLFTPEDENTLYRAFEDKNGVADIDVISKVIGDIMKKSNTAKKSSPSHT
jgi:hypothetical protein